MLLLLVGLLLLALGIYLIHQSHEITRSGTARFEREVTGLINSFTDKQNAVHGRLEKDARRKLFLGIGALVLGAFVTVAVGLRTASRRGLSPGG